MSDIDDVEHDDDDSMSTSSGIDSDCERRPLHLFSLPPEILDHILSFLTYEEISLLRPVCKTFDNRCQILLNQGFGKAERFRHQCLKLVKAQLPRRESERRQHPLARHNEIVTAVDTRLSLLSMTFTKFMDTKLCCFIPGKVLDEIFRVLQQTRQQKRNLPRAHELLVELRDISSMAMEYFDEHIAPDLKKQLNELQPTISETEESQEPRVNNKHPRVNIHNNRNVLIENWRNCRAIRLLRFKLDYQKLTLGDQRKELLVQSKEISKLNHRVRLLEQRVTELCTFIGRQDPSPCQATTSIGGGDGDNRVLRSAPHRGTGLTTGVGAGHKHKHTSDDRTEDNTVSKRTKKSHAKYKKKSR